MFKFCSSALKAINGRRRQVYMIKLNIVYNHTHIQTVAWSRQTLFLTGITVKKSPFTPYNAESGILFYFIYLFYLYHVKKSSNGFIKPDVIFGIYYGIFGITAAIQWYKGLDIVRLIKQLFM
jgi:hypothetical protein